MNIIIILSIIIITLFVIVGFTKLPHPSTIFKVEGIETGNCPTNIWPAPNASSDLSSISVSATDYDTQALLNSYCTIGLQQRLTNSQMTAASNLYDPFNTNPLKENITDLRTAVNTARWWVDQVFFQKSPGFEILKKKSKGSGYYYKINIFKEKLVPKTTSNSMGDYLFINNPTHNTFLKDQNKYGY